MVTHFEEIHLDTSGEGDMVDITPIIVKVINSSGIGEGMVCVSCIGSTGSVTTIEFEPGLCQDFPETLERLMPKNQQYLHHETWHDDNGRSHVRASLMGPGIVVPIHDGTMVLGTWQQVAFVEHDTRSRNRRLAVQVMGE